MVSRQGTADDGYDAHYTAKLWSLLPEVYRSLTPEGPGTPPVLVALVEVLGSQVAEIRRRIDRIWEDQAIETADAWKIDEVAAMLGTRTVASLGDRERRVDVANTIHYRRRRGTPVVLEALADDLTEWDSTVTESFTTLARTLHLLDPAPPSLTGSLRTGRLSGVPRGGLVDVRHRLATDQVGGPFDEFGHRVDVRLPRGTQGHHRIDGVTIHLWRARVLQVSDVDPVAVAPQVWTVDPSGRDLLLAMRGTDEGSRRQDAAARRSTGAGPAWGRPAPWEVPGPMTCHHLAHQTLEVTASGLAGLSPTPTTAQRAGLDTLVGLRFPDRTTFVQHLRSAGITAPTSQPWFPSLLAASLDPGCGLRTLYPDSIGVSLVDGAGDRFDLTHVHPADLADLTTVPTPSDASVRGLVDPARGRVAVLTPTAGAPRIRRYHHAVSHPVGAGTDDWTPTTPGPATHTGGGPVVVGAAPVRFGDNRTYAVRLPGAPVPGLALTATGGHRPYLLLDDGTAPGGRVVPTDSTAQVLLEGVWAGAAGDADLVVGPGTWTGLAVRHVTLDPGGNRADGAPIGALRLVVEGDVDTVLLERCVLGPVVVSGTVGALVVRDCIVDARSTGALAVDAPLTEVTLTRVTAHGGVSAGVLRATDCLVAGQVTVADTQSGCFRFSAADGDSRLPPRFRTWPPPGDPRPVGSEPFLSVRFGDEGYLDLHPTAPAALRRGSEQGEQMGAHGPRRLQAKLAGIRAKLTEYAPARVSLGLVEET